MGDDVKAEKLVSYFLAVKQGDIKRLESFLSNEKFEELCDVEGRNGLHVAATCGNLATLSYLLSTLPDGLDIQCLTKRKKTALYLAAEKGNHSIVEELLQKGAKDIDCVGSTALHRASEEGFSKTVEILLKNGSNPNQRKKLYHSDEGSSLHLAALGGHAAVCELLLNYNADVMLKKGGKEMTSLHCAVLGGHIEVIQVMLEYLQKNKGNLLLPFLEASIKISDDGYDGLSFGSDEGSENSATTPVGIACEKDFDHILSLLLEAGAQPDSLNVNGNHPLHLAIHSKDSPVAVVDILLQKGAEVDPTNDKLETPLNLAVNFRNLPVVQTLLAKQANAAQLFSQGGPKSKEKVFLMDLAAQFGDKQILRDLLNSIIRKRKADKASLSSLAPLDKRTFWAKTLRQESLRKEANDPSSSNSEQVRKKSKERVRIARKVEKKNEEKDHKMELTNPK